VVFVTPGAGGAPAATGGSPGSGGNWTGGVVNKPSLATEHTGITGITANRDHVYWVDYGSRDRLGNYNNDGSLHALSLEDGSITMLASNLAGPLGVGVSNSYVYVMGDGGPLIGTEELLQAWRVPLSGGSAQRVQTSSLSADRFSAFVSAGTQAFWRGRTGIFRISDDESEATEFPLGRESQDYLLPVAATEAHLYYSSVEYGGVRRALIADRSTEDLARPARAVGVRGELMYSVESLQDDAGLLLTRAPVAGGNWVRMRALGGGGIYGGLFFRVVGDRYFFLDQESYPNSVGFTVATGFLDSDDPPVRVLETNVSPSMAFSSVWWVGTAKALFWTDGDRVYRRTIE
jgi:hypothetical protein